MRSIKVLTALICLIGMMQPTYALIKLDAESIDIAVKYGLDNKYSTLKDLLGPNWVEDKEGRILNVYSPFIQLAVKASSQKSLGSGDEDVRIVRSKLFKTIKTVQAQDFIKIHVSFFGATPDFATKVKGFIVPAALEAQPYGDFMPDEKFKNPKKRKRAMIKPAKDEPQKVADQDNYHPLLPYSAINTYNFKFDKVKPLKKFYFVLLNVTKDEDGEQDEKLITYFLIDNNAIF